MEYSLRHPPIKDDRIRSDKQLADFASDLTDEEIMNTARIVRGIQQKYAGKPNTEQNLEHLRDELLTKLAEINVLATVDPSPCFYGEPPIVEIVGKLGGDPIHKYGFDHERKRHEVLESKKRNEDYRGQKEPYNKRRNK